MDRSASQPFQYHLERASPNAMAAAKNRKQSEPSNQSELRRKRIRRPPKKTPDVDSNELARAILQRELGKNEDAARCLLARAAAVARHWAASLPLKSVAGWRP